jgi:hypothetical protein
MGDHATALGTLTAGGDLVLGRAVVWFRVFLDTRRAVVVCPRCGTAREFRGGSVFSSRAQGMGEPDRTVGLRMVESERQN